MPTFDTFMLVHFYTASALQAMQTAIIATGCPSVRLSRSGILFRRKKVRSWGLQHQVGQSF